MMDSLLQAKRGTDNSGNGDIVTATAKMSPVHTLSRTGPIAGEERVLTSTKEKQGEIVNKALAEMSRKAFVYECASRSLAASFSNPTTKPSIASMVRDAEKLWEELQEWENRQESPS